MRFCYAEYGGDAVKYAATVGDRTYIIEINPDGEVVVDGERHTADLQSIDGQGTYSLIMNGESYEVLVEERADEIGVLLRGRLYGIKVQDERASRLSRSSHGFGPATGEISIKSPMPGLIVAVKVAPGDEVVKGQPLVVLESMKMENELKAPRAGKVIAVKAEPRQAVEQHQVLVTLE